MSGNKWPKLGAGGTFGIGFVLMLGFVLAGTRSIPADVSSWETVLFFFCAPAGLYALLVRFAIIEAGTHPRSLRLAALILAVPSAWLVYLLVAEGRRAIAFNEGADSTRGEMVSSRRGNHARFSYTVRDSQFHAFLEIPDHAGWLRRGDSAAIYYLRQAPDSANIGPARPAVGWFGGWLAFVWLVIGPVLVSCIAGLRIYYEAGAPLRAKVGVESPPPTTPDLHP